MEVVFLLAAERDLQEAYNWVAQYRHGKELSFLRDLDSRLEDLNAVLGMNPNHVRAHMDRGRLFERRHDLAQARADYRSAAYALTHFDELDVAMARQTAHERLDALTAQGPSVGVGRRAALVIGNGAYRNVPPLDNPSRDSRLIAASLRDLGFP